MLTRYYRSVTNTNTVIATINIWIDLPTSKDNESRNPLCYNEFSQPQLTSHLYVHLTKSESFPEINTTSAVVIQ